MSDDKWNGEDWAEFKEVLRTEAGGFMSLREAERALRKLCASGVVRAVEFSEDGPKFVAPKDWTGDDFDPEPVYLSTVDLSRYWCDLQNRPPPKPTGKQPRIKAHLAELFPNGVPDPAHCPRKALKADLLRRDPSLSPLDEATLKSAIEAYNSSHADPKQS
jgi:hypothetical protein